MRGPVTGFRATGLDCRRLGWGSSGAPPPRERPLGRFTWISFRLPWAEPLSPNPGEMPTRDLYPSADVPRRPVRYPTQAPARTHVASATRMAGRPAGGVGPIAPGTLR